ncbi:unnamed protein product [Rhizopus stolonifer]
MPYEYVDVVRKIDNLVREQETFSRAITDAFDNLKNELRTLVGNQGESNNGRNQFIATRLSNEETVREYSNVQTIARIRKTPDCSKWYGNGETARIMGYIAETKNLVQLENDSDEMILSKRKCVQDYVDLLYSYAKSACFGIHQRVLLDESLDKLKMTWGKVPRTYKERGDQIFMEMATLSDIHIDRSEDDWLPWLIMARRYHNKYNPKRKQKKQGTSETASENSGSTSPNAESSAMAGRHARNDE